MGIGDALSDWSYHDSQGQGTSAAVHHVPPHQRFGQPTTEAMSAGDPFSPGQMSWGATTPPAAPLPPHLRATPPSPIAGGAPTPTHLRQQSSWGATDLATSPSPYGGDYGGGYGGGYDPHAAPLWPQQPQPVAADHHGTKAAGPQGGTLRVYAVSWNMASKPYPDQLADLLQWDGADNGGAHPGDCDIYAIGVQEAPSSFPGWHAVWEHSMNAALGLRDFVRVDSCTLEPGGWIHIAVYMRRALTSWLSEVRRQGVSCGIGKVVGNKGGVGISFLCAGTRFAFVNCHLAAHTHKLKERNDDYERIATRIFARRQAACAPRRVQPGGADACSSGDGLLEGHDVVVWMGDMNYRIGGGRPEIESALNAHRWDFLQAQDQLLGERAAGRCFRGFQEGELRFRPTFKFDIGSDSYDTSKKAREPAWTDRVLFATPPLGADGAPRAAVSLRSYGCVHAVRTSDHRPVAVRLDVALYGKRQVPTHAFFVPTHPTGGCF